MVFVFFMLIVVFEYILVYGTGFAFCGLCALFLFFLVVAGLFLGFWCLVLESV